MLLGHLAAGGPEVLDVPVWALAWVVLATSVIVVLICRVHHVPRPRTVPESGPRADSESPGGLVLVVRVAAASVLASVLWFAWFGPAGIAANVASLAIVGILWPLGGWIALAFGWCWEKIAPVLLLGRLGDRRRQRRAAPTVRPPVWAPVPVFATWVVVWVAWIRGDEPRNLAIWATLYLAGLGIVAVRGGTAAVRAADPLPLALDLAAGIARPGRAASRAPGPDDRSRVTLVAAMVMGALAANRAAATGWFNSVVADHRSLASTAATFVGFAAFSAGIGALWWACGRVLDRARSERGTHRIGPALGPVAGGLLLAQGFPVGLVAVQDLLIVASDPFGRGWNIFGTVYRQVTPDLLSGFAVGTIQTVVIMAGHVSALVMVSQAATEPGTDGSTSVRRRHRAFTAALPAMTAVTVGGVGWTVLLVGG